jgi:hypothetical protein
VRWLSVGVCRCVYVFVWMFVCWTQLRFIECGQVGWVAWEVDQACDFNTAASGSKVILTNRSCSQQTLASQCGGSWGERTHEDVGVVLVCGAACCGAAQLRALHVSGCLEQTSAY